MKHIYKRYSGIISFFLLQSTFCFPQVQVLTGKITEEGSGKTVGYAYIQNFTRQTTIYSNSSGNFKIEAGSGDTLVLYSAGYLYKKVIVDDSMLLNQPVSYTLSIPQYQLDEARIVAIGSYEDLKNRIIHYDLPQTETQQLNNYMSGISKIAARESYLQAEAKRHAEGFSVATVPILTPEEKERIKLDKIIEEQLVKDQVYQKFNPMIVKKITGLTEDDEIIEFMVFCKFSDKYLLEVNEYDLASRISAKFELFKRKKQEENSEPNPLNIIETFSSTLA